jgi:hypothetical protein
MKGYVTLFARLSYQRFIFVRFCTPELKIAVRDTHVETCLPEKREQNHRINPTACCNQNPIVLFTECISVNMV